MHSLVASGLPLPLGGLTDLAMAVGGEEVAAARLAAKDRSKPFPCQDKPCGCNSAKQCFSSCCCHTPKELLAWARANGLEPAVLTALTHRMAAETHQQDSPSPPSTESTARKASCCASTTAALPSLSPPAIPALHDPADPAEICSDYESLAATPPSRSSCCSPADTLELPDASQPKPEPDSRRTVVLSAMLACGGIASGWLSGGIAIVTPLHAAMTPLELLPAGSLTLVDETSLRVFSAPDLPPPRGLAG